MTVTILGINVVVTAILYLCFAVAIDTVFGLGRALRYRCWNSSLGINGAVRKVSMIACVTFMVLLDGVCRFNLIQIFPADVITYLGQAGLHKVGFAEFFVILFIAYECVSILKNMYMCGLPVKWVWAKVYTFLNKYTDELPDTDGVELK